METRDGAVSTIPAIEQVPMTLRQRLLVGAAVVSNTVEYFDFFIIGFVISIVAVPWELTFGQSSVVLLAAGLGTTLGAIFWGRLADHIGRRPCFLWTVVTFSVATGACAAVPEGNWWLLAFLRVVVGFGVGGLPMVDIPLIAEFVPTKHRARLAGLPMVFIPIGLFLGGQTSALWGDTLGWRGLLLIGLAPVLLAFPIRLIVRESPRWLITQGRHDEAREAVAWYRGMRQEDVELPDVERQATKERGVGFRRIWRHHRRAFLIAMFGVFCFQMASASVQAWGPTLLTQIMNTTAKHAAELFILVSAMSLIGRVFSSNIADRVGRKPIMVIGGLVGSVFVAVIALAGDAALLGVSVFYLGILGMFLFADGAWGVLNTFVTEMFPSEVRATGFGISYGLGALGKVAGPALLGLIAGSNVITPEASQQAVTPAFLIMAGSLVIGAVIFSRGRETRGRSLEELVEPTATK